MLAFDTGPGHMVSDAVVSTVSHGKQALDLNGRWARRGNISNALLHEMMAHPFIRRPPPKSTGREEFGEAFTQRLMKRARRLRLVDADIVATATAFTVETIAEAYQRCVFPRLTPAMLSRLQVILGGGGARNPTLRQMLAERIGRLRFSLMKILASTVLPRKHWPLPSSVTKACMAARATCLT